MFKLLLPFNTDFPFYLFDFKCYFVTAIGQDSAANMPDKHDISRIWIDLVRWMKKTSRKIRITNVEEGLKASRQ